MHKLATQVLHILRVSLSVPLPPPPPPPPPPPTPDFSQLLGYVQYGEIVNKVDLIIAISLSILRSLSPKFRNEVATEVCNPAINWKLVNSKVYMDLKTWYILKNWGFCYSHRILGAIIIYQISARNNFVPGESILHILKQGWPPTMVPDGKWLRKLLNISRRVGQCVIRPVIQPYGWNPSIYSKAARIVIRPVIQPDGWNPSI